MSFSDCARVAAIMLAASRIALAQAWCEVPTAKPYSRNMPGITSVSVASVRRASAAIENFPQNSYALATDTVTLSAGESYTIAIAHTRDSVAFPKAGNNIRVWIDYDRDGKFTGANELVVTGDALVPGLSTFSFTVPRQVAPVSGTRMRVTAKMSTQTGHSHPTPCDEPRDGFGYHGEIEDYPVRIVKPPEGPADVRSLEPELRRQFDRVSSLLVRLAEKMPDDAYAFQAAPNTRTFAAAVAHAAITNLNVCGSLLQRRHPQAGTILDVAAKSKADAVAALKTSIAFCSEYTGPLKAGDLTDRFFDVSTLRDGKSVAVRTAHASLVTNLIAHGNEMYGYLAVYLRLKGIVPPSTEG
jgi:hypothetical protein